MIKNIILFYQNPYTCFNTGDCEPIKEKMIFLKRTYLFCLYAGFVVIFMIMVVDNFLESKFCISIYENLSRNRNAFWTSHSRTSSFVQMCLIGPFIEECIFRLPLLTKSSLLKGVICFVFILYFFSGSFQLNISFWWYYAVLITIFGGIIIFNNNDPQPIFEQKNYNYLCWILTITFALLHVANFLPLNGAVFYLYPIYVLPQFVHGTVQSYLAIKYNSILWPFLLHAGINATAELSRLVTDAF